MPRGLELMRVGNGTHVGPSAPDPTWLSPFPTFSPSPATLEVHTEGNPKGQKEEKEHCITSAKRCGPQNIMKVERKLSGKTLILFWHYHLYLGFIRLIPKASQPLASPEILIDMQNLRPHSRSTDSECTF